MSNTSATGGYLTPAGAVASEEDVDLEDLLQGMVSGITGLSGKMVRPRWQTEMPKQPERGESWCAIGVHASKTASTPVIVHNGNGNGFDRFEVHEDLTILATFYGPSAQFFGGRLRDGIFIRQNGEAARANGMAFVSATELKPNHELVNEQWIRRYDLFIHMRRKIVRTYQVLNIVSADVVIVE